MYIFVGGDCTRMFMSTIYQWLLLMVNLSLTGLSNQTSLWQLIVGKIASNCWYDLVTFCFNVVRQCCYEKGAHLVGGKKNEESGLHPLEPNWIIRLCGASQHPTAGANKLCLCACLRV